MLGPCLHAQTDSSESLQPVSRPILSESASKRSPDDKPRAATSAPKRRLAQGDAAPLQFTRIDQQPVSQGVLAGPGREGTDRQCKRGGGRPAGCTTQAKGGRCGKGELGRRRRRRPAGPETQTSQPRRVRQEWPVGGCRKARGAGKGVSEAGGVWVAQKGRKGEGGLRVGGGRGLATLRRIHSRGPATHIMNKHRISVADSLPTVHACAVLSIQIHTVAVIAA